MRDENQGRRPHPYEQSRNDQRGGQGGQSGADDRQGGGYREQGQFRGTHLFDDRQDRMNQFERSSYGHNERSGDYGFDPQYGGRNYGEDQFGGGADYSRGQQSSQRGGFGQEGQNQQGLRSRSADPGQSSYGGFTNEDTRYQHQQLGDYTGRRDYGRESGSGQAYGREASQPNWQSGAQQGRQGMQHRSMPKGYKRSDERVREDLCEQLSYSGLDVSEVSVEVSQGRVTLEGKVRDRRTKHAIEDRAAECMGIEEVENRIRIEHQWGNFQEQATSDTGQQAGASGHSMKSTGSLKSAQDNNES